LSNDVFLTGCDKNTEWMLKWFYSEYLQHNSTPMVFANFGVTDEMLSWVNDNFHEVLDMTKETGKGWFLKPISMLTASKKYDKVCWIDTDIHVLKYIGDIFRYSKADKLGMVQDRPWSKRHGEMWYNSGVVLVEGTPRILHEWIEAIKTNPSKGDQETLHYYLGTPLNQDIFIEPLSHIYNNLRLDIIDGIDNPNKRVMHWTGNKGKDVIRKLMSKKNG